MKGRADGGKGEGIRAQSEVDYGKEKVERVTREHAAGYKSDICEKERDTTQHPSPINRTGWEGKRSKINDELSTIRISW